MGCMSSRDSDVRARRLSLLSASPFFLHLSSEQLELFAERFEIAFIKAGGQVFEQGDQGHEFFIVGEGECDITCAEEEGEIDEHGRPQQRFLCSKKAGDMFGENCILNEDATRSATVTVTDDCTMLVLSRLNFRAYMSTLDSLAQLRICSLMGTKMLDTLREIEFLSGIDDFRLGLLANVFRYKTVQPGEVVFQEGDAGRELYIVSEGQVSVSAKGGIGADASEVAHLKRGSFIACPSPPTTGAGGAYNVDGGGDGGQNTTDDVQFATLSSGQIFGEVSLMVDLPRTATVRAISRCLLLVLSAVDFGNFVAIVPGLREKMAALASARVAKQFAKFDIPFFQGLGEHRMKALSDLCVLETVDPDTVLFTEGDVPQPNAAAFYLVVSGALEASKAEVGVVATLLPPSFCGEVALVTDSPRTATIVASTRAVLLSLTKENFESFFLSDGGDGEAQYAEFSIKLSQFQAPLKPVLNHALGHSLFTQHLATEYSQENLIFFDAAGAYALLETEEERHSTARDLVHNFISPDAEQQVNIPAAVRESCLSEARTSGGADRLLFAEARREVFKLMEVDSFKRFKQTPGFKQLLEAVGSYETKAPQQQSGGLQRLSTTTPPLPHKSLTPPLKQPTPPLKQPSPPPPSSSEPIHKPLEPQRPRIISNAFATSLSPVPGQPSSPSSIHSGISRRHSVNIHLRREPSSPSNQQLQARR